MQFPDVRLEAGALKGADSWNKYREAAFRARHPLAYLVVAVIALLILASISSVMYPQSRRIKTEV
jgi:hypothetical protein